jgi:hypothetical protein
MAFDGLLEGSMQKSKFYFNQNPGGFSMKSRFLGILVFAVVLFGTFFITINSAKADSEIFVHEDASGKLIAESAQHFEYAFQRWDGTRAVGQVGGGFESMAQWSLVVISATITPTIQGNLSWWEDLGYIELPWAQGFAFRRQTRIMEFSSTEGLLSLFNTGQEAMPRHLAVEITGDHILALWETPCGQEAGGFTCDYFQLEVGDIAEFEATFTAGAPFTITVSASWEGWSETRSVFVERPTPILAEVNSALPGEETQILGQNFIWGSFQGETMTMVMEDPWGDNAEVVITVISDTMGKMTLPATLAPGTNYQVTLVSPRGNSSGSLQTSGNSPGSMFTLTLTADTSVVTATGSIDATPWNTQMCFGGSCRLVSLTDGNFLEIWDGLQPKTEYCFVTKLVTASSDLRWQSPATCITTQALPPDPDEDYYIFLPLVVRNRQ